MKLRTFTLVALLFSITWPLFAQKVSTLVNDPNKEFAAMHWHEDGRIYAVDYFNGRLYQVYLNGTVRTLISSEFKNLAGGGFDKKGNFYFAAIAKGEIYRLNQDESFTLIASGFKQPVGILAHPTDDDLLFITEYESSKVTKISISTGAKTQVVAGKGINGPDAIIYDWSGNFLISNWNNHRINTVDTLGNVTPFATVPANGFMGYVNRIGDFLYVPSFSAKKLYRIDKEGNVQLIAGTGAPGYKDGDGSTATFTRPNGTCHNPAGDTLLVSDHQTIRIITDFEPIISSVDEAALQNLSLSPNPATDMLNISLKVEPGNKLEWKIYDLEGRAVKEGIANHPNGDDLNIQIPISELIPAAYVIHFNDGSTLYTHKFVKVKK